MNGLLYLKINFSKYNFVYFFGFIFSILTIILTFPANSYSQTYYKTNSVFEKIEFFIHEGEFIEGKSNEKKYLYDYPIDEYFKKYNGKHLPQEKTYKRRIYTLKGFLKIDKHYKDKVLSLYAGPIDYPANFYLNKVLIHKVGRYKKTYNSTIYTASNIILPSELLNYDDEVNEIAVELYPKYEIRPFTDIYISRYENVSGCVFWRNFFNVYLIQASVFLSILILTNIIINIIYRRYNRQELIKYVYFCFLCLFFCCSYISITFYSISFNELLLEKISRIGFSMMGVAFTIFIIELTGFIKRKTFLKIALIFLGISLSIITALQDSKESIRYVFDIVMFIEIIPFFILNLIILLISIFKYKNRTSLYILLALILIIILSIHDILALSIYVYIPYAWLTSYGYIFIVLALYVLLSIEHSIIYKKLVERNNIIKSSLEIAQNVQRQFVKRVNTKFNNYRVYTYYKPMDSVSGDFYELIKIPENNIGIFIADVSGHGVGSGIVTSMLKILCRSSKNIVIKPDKFLKYINMNLTGIIGNNHITAFYGIIDYDSMEFIYSNASHCYPILIRKNDNIIQKLKSTGGMIGVSKKLDYYIHKLDIKKGDILLFFTDGLIDTMNKKGELFDYREIFKILRKFKDSNINIIVNELIKACNEFSNSNKLNDDLSIVCVEIL